MTPHEDVPHEQQRRAWPWVLGAGLGALLIGGGVLAGVLLADGGEPSGASGTPSPTPTAPAAPAGQETSPYPSAPGSLGACDELAGLPTDEVVEVGLCDDTAPADTVLISTGRECGDGSTLHWNDHGWGFTGGEWHAHERADGQLVPPDAELDSC